MLWCGYLQLWTVFLRHRRSPADTKDGLIREFCSWLDQSIDRRHPLALLAERTPLGRTTELAQGVALGSIAQLCCIEGWMREQQHSAKTKQIPVAEHASRCASTGLASRSF